MDITAVHHSKIIKVSSAGSDYSDDYLAVEAPLEICLTSPLSKPPIINKNISITMRTPGNDGHLALGFLFTEGILVSYDQVASVEDSDNKVEIIINNPEKVDLSKIERHFYTSSSCGVCGKASIELIKTVCRLDKSSTDFCVDANAIKSIPEKVKERQAVFKNTGGLHAAALLDTEFNFISLYEDVGRHNALDKVIGAAFITGNLPLNQHLVLLSGRASFELIQKAAMAGISFVMAVGAPSSLAVELAKEFDITLIGFLNSERFNIYHGEKRIKM